MLVRYIIHFPTRRLGKILAFVMCLSSGFAIAQETAAEYILPENAKYFGYSMTFGVQSYTLTSDISKLDQLTVTREGGNVGLFAGNRMIAIRSNVGLYYSSPSVPYSIDVLEAGLAAQLYLLQLGTKQYHTFEPYFSLSTKGMRSSFYGNFMEAGRVNNSTVDDNQIGRINSLHGFAGIGVEYQLMMAGRNFFHMFVEGRYGTSFQDYATGGISANTGTKNPMLLVAGVNFGKIKYRQHGRRR